MSPEDTSAWIERPAPPVANQVYGLLVVGAALAVARPGAQSRWTVFLDVFAAAAVYSIAHVYADVLEQRVHHARGLTSSERHEIGRNALVILRATGIPFLALVVCSAFRLRATTSVTVVLWLLVGELAVTSWLATRHMEPVGRRARYAVGATALGLVLIVLKIVTH